MRTQSQNSQQLLEVSVVVPYFRGVDELRQCLGCLRAQSLPSERFEVIVVNNSGKPLPTKLLSHSNFRFFEETRAGSYAARNTGLSQARAPIVAFTDSDCQPSSDWLEAGLRYLRDNPQMSYGGGKICIQVSNPVKIGSIELFESIFYGYFQREAVNQLSYAITANAFVRRSSLVRVGSFDPSYLSGGDVEWGRRAAYFGERCGYIGEARVTHPSRKRLWQMYAKIRRITGGHVRLEASAYLWNLGILRSAYQLLIPPVRTLHWALKEKHSQYSCRKRFLVALIYWGARYFQLAERIRLSLGGKPVRV